MVEWFRQRNLVQRYSLVALPIMFLAMMILGWWVGKEIKLGTINRVSGDSALFVENFVVGPLQELAVQDFISESNSGHLGAVTFRKLTGFRNCGFQNMAA